MGDKLTTLDEIYAFVPGGQASCPVNTWTPDTPANRAEQQENALVSRESQLKVILRQEDDQ